MNTVALNKLERFSTRLRDLGEQFTPIDLHHTYIFRGRVSHGRTVAHSPFQKTFLFPKKLIIYIFIFRKCFRISTTSKSFWVLVLLPPSKKYLGKRSRGDLNTVSLNSLESFSTYYVTFKDNLHRTYIFRGRVSHGRLAHSSFQKTSENYQYIYLYLENVFRIMGRLLKDRIG